MKNIKCNFNWNTLNNSSSVGAWPNASSAHLNSQLSIVPLENEEMSVNVFDDLNEFNQFPKKKKYVLSLTYLRSLSNARKASRHPSISSWLRTMLDFLFGFFPKRKRGKVSEVTWCQRIELWPRKAVKRHENQRFIAFHLGKHSNEIRVCSELVSSLKDMNSILYT
jgi:hypothetical protein